MTTNPFPTSNDTDTGLTLGDIGYDDDDWHGCRECSATKVHAKDCPIVKHDDGEHYAACPECGYYSTTLQHTVEDSDEYDLP